MYVLLARYCYRKSSVCLSVSEVQVRLDKTYGVRRYSGDRRDGAQPDSTLSSIARRRQKASYFTPALALLLSELI